MRYYFYLFEQLGHPVFGHAQHGYPSFIARFIKPIVSKRPGLLYYFERFGTSVQFCFFTDDFETVRNDIDYLCQKLAIVPNQAPAPEGATLESAFGSVRFLGPQNSTTAAKRAELVLRYRVSELIKVLHAAKDLTPEQAQTLAGLEWFFLPILETNMVTPKTLTDGIRRDPTAYLQFVKLIYAPDRNVDLGIKIERTEETSKRAQNAHDLLGSIQELPGSVGGVVNEAEFLTWLTEVRRLAAEAGYVKSVENELGQLLTLAPNDPEGFWPCAPVARVLNDSNTKEMLSAFRAEIFNNQSRGGFLPGHPDMNPTKERKAAIARLRDNAAKLNLEFPIVAACLRDVADDQERFVVDFLEKD